MGLQQMPRRRFPLQTPFGKEKHRLLELQEVARGGSTAAEQAHTCRGCGGSLAAEGWSTARCWALPVSLPGPAGATVTCRISWGRSMAGPCRNGIFQAAPTIFWKDQPIFVLDGERPLRRWVEYKSLLSHCSKQTPTKSHSNYFLQRQGKALFCALPAQEDTQNWLLPFSKPVAVYTFP